jgi:hypothetical protein
MYSPSHPEYPAPGEPFSPEPATYPGSTFENGQYHFASIIPAASEDDEDILLSIKQGFDREHVTVQTPHDFAQMALREYLAQRGLEEDPDNLVLTTLYVEAARVKEGPWRAQVAHEMTLTQAMIANWQQQGNGCWFDHLGHPMAWRKEGYEVNQMVPLSSAPLSSSEAYDGIYRRTNPQTYGAATQVDLDPAAFRSFIWNAKLQGHYLEYLRHFWSNHGHAYHLMIKGNLVRAALLQRDEGSLGTEHAALVLKSLMLSPDTSWDRTSFRYFADNPVSHTRTLSTLRIYGYESSDIIVIGEQGREHKVLYIPGNASPLHGFASADELRDWIAHQCRDPRKRAAIASHFRSKDREDGIFFSGVNTALAGLGAHPNRLNDATGHWYPHAIITFGDALYPYPMSDFRDRIRERLFSDADYDIDTQGKYYSKLTAYGVELAANIVGGLAVAIPALAPVAVALGVGLLAVGAGEMVAAHGRDEEIEGAQRLVFGLLNALPLAGEISQLTATRALLTESERIAAQAAQEQRAAQMALDKQHWGGRVPETTEEFKAIRPVHDALQGDLGDRLKTLAVTRPLRVTGGGKGTFLDEGKIYVRIRPEVYRVQWLEHEQQFRICSEGEPLVWGPFLHCLDDGYWDIDLRYGLRGGAPSVKVLEHLPSPVEVIRGIETQPMLPKVAVSIAVDDLVWNDAGHYEADILYTHDGKEKLDVKQTIRQPVWYDADAAAWRQDNNYIWREAYGKDRVRWRIGDARSFERVRHKLPFETSITEYSFPLLPQLPLVTTPIPNEIHMIWVGEGELNVMIKHNIVKNLRVKGYRFVLHLDNDEVALAANQKWCREVGVEARNLREQPFFQDFTGGPDGKAYNYFRFPHNASRNYAAACDYLRFRLIDELGGFYLDVDDSLLVSEAPSLSAAADDVLVGGEYKMPWNQKPLINTSHFASHRDNPVLKRLLREANERFEALPEAFKNTPRPIARNFENKLEAQQKMNEYMQAISSLAGPDAFNEGLKRMRPDYYGLIATSPSYAWVHSTVFDELYTNAVAHWFPLRMNGIAGIQPGSAHTWMHT